MVRQINQKLRRAIDAEGRISRLEGDWWQLSLTQRTELEPSAVSLLTISRDRAGVSDRGQAQEVGRQLRTMRVKDESAPDTQRTPEQPSFEDDVVAW